MRPADGDFVDAVAEVVGDHERLEIETISIDFASRENVPSRVAREHFEPALGVIDATNAEDLDGGVEGSAENFSVEGLANFEFAFSQRPTSDGDVGPLEDARQQLFGLFLGRGQVGVAEEDDVAEEASTPNRTA